MVTDKNGTEILIGSWLRAVPQGLDVEKVGVVSSLSGSGQIPDVEVLPPGSEPVVAKLAAGFEGGGGGFGGGGASGGWIW